MSDDVRQRMKHMLKEIGDMAEDASLTGAFASGTREAIRKYNSILDWVIKEDSAPEGLFERLPDDADWGRIGVESRMLSSYMHGGKKHRHVHGCDDPGVLVALAPFLRREDLVDMIEDQINKADAFDDGILVALAPFVGSDLLGRLVRKNVERKRPEPAPQPEERPRPTPPAPPAERMPVQVPQATPAPQVAVPDKPDISEILKALRDVNLTAEERAELAMRLTNGGE